jgi:hypothetical protein
MKQTRTKKQKKVNYLEQLDLLNEKFIRRRVSFSKSEYQFILNRESFKDRLKGFLTMRYHRRKKLIKSGNVGFCYTFSLSISKYYNHEFRPSFVLFTPKKTLMCNEKFYLDVLANLYDFQKKKAKTLKESHLQAVLSEKDAEPRYFELPKKITKNELVYLQYVEVNTKHTHNLKFGMNPIIFNKNISDEVIYLPDFLKDIKE